MPTKRQLYQTWATEHEFPETRREGDPAYRKPNTPPPMPNPKDDLPVMVVTDPDGYLVLVGEPRKLTAKECRDYMAPGWEVKTMKFKEYKALNLNFRTEDGE